MLRYIYPEIGRPIYLGKVQENESLTVVFNIDDWLEEYPSGNITLLHRRPADAGGLPVANLTIEDGRAYWLVTSGDLAYEGTGKCELTLTQDSIVRKSRTYDTKIIESIAPAGTEPPEPIQGYIIQLINKADDVIAAINLYNAMTASAQTLAEGSNATAVLENNILTLGIPRGARGVGIATVAKTATAGLVDTYTITFDDNRTATFTVTNGDKGDKGDPGRGIIPGGSAGQVLAKNSNADYDMKWQDNIVAETDPTVPSWAKQPSKPSYTAQEIGGLSGVATSGSYNDLSNKPSIPNEQTVAGWGFTKNNGTYTKPDGGIPKTDLAQAVQSSLNKADTAVQDISGKQDAPATAGTAGQVLSLDSQLNPVWKNDSSLPAAPAEDGIALVSVGGAWSEQAGYGYTEDDDGNEIVHLIDDKYVHAKQGRDDLGEPVQGAVREGGMTFASGQYSHAEGYSTRATDFAAHAEGLNTEATETYAHSEGYSTEASGVAAHSEGGSSEASGNYAHAEGNGTLASGTNSHAEGGSSVASYYDAHAEGSSTKATEEAAHAEGYGSVASGYTSHAEGSLTFASGSSSHTEGFNTVARGNCSHAEGECTVTSYVELTSKADTASNKIYIFEDGSDLAVGKAIVFDDKVAIITNVDETTSEVTVDNGFGEYLDHEYVDVLSGPIATGYGAHAEGTSTMVTGDYAHGEGSGSKASGQYSHAEGQMSTASGVSSHAEGTATIASAFSAHAEGTATTASGAGAHSEGTGTTASGPYAHTEGAGTQASGSMAHAEGSGSVASGYNAHAEGNGTIASGVNAHASGQFNLDDTLDNWNEWVAGTSYSVGDRVKVTSEGVANTFICKTANSDNVFDYSKWTNRYGRKNFATIVGNGEDNSHRSNAHTVDWDGNAEYAGDVKANACGGQNPISLIDVATALNKEIAVQSNQPSSSENKLWINPTGSGEIVVPTQAEMEAALDGKASVIGTPSDGQFLVYSSSVSAYVPTTVPAASGVSF